MRQLRPTTIAVILGLLTLPIILAVKNEFQLAKINQVTIREINKGPINLLTADALTLTLIPGIGSRLSERIINYRRQNRITGINDLLNIKGIGPTLLERIKPMVVIGKQKK